MINLWWRLWSLDCPKPTADMHIAQVGLLVSSYLPVLKATSCRMKKKRSMLYVFQIYLMVLAATVKLAFRPVRQTTVSCFHKKLIYPQFRHSIMAFLRVHNRAGPNIDQFWLYKVSGGSLFILFSSCEQFITSGISDIKTEGLSRPTMMRSAIIPTHILFSSGHLLPPRWLRLPLLTATFGLSCVCKAVGA